MKKLIITTLSLFLTISASAQTKDWAMSFRFGEPTGLGIRKYGDRNLLDVSIGTYGGIFGGRRNYRQGEYRRVGVALNASYLWYTSFLNERMTAYAGVGAQLNSRRYYRIQDGIDRSNRNVSIGPTGTIGMEYFGRNAPFSMFVEGGAYLEILPAVFYASPQLNVGVRYNF